MTLPFWPTVLGLLFLVGLLVAYLCVCTLSGEISEQERQAEDAAKSREARE